MLLPILILSSVVLGNMLLGFLVLSKNPRSRTAISFFLFAVTVSAWALFNFLTDNAQSLSLSLTSARLANFFALICVLSLWCFTSFYARGQQASAYKKKLLIFIPALIISLTPLGIKAVTEITNVANQQIGVLYWLVVLTLIIGFGGMVSDLLFGLRHTKEKYKHASIRLMVIGTIFTFTFAITSNIFLPILFASWEVSQFGPIFTLLLVGTIGLSIVKHRFFDIRLVAARFLAYILSISFAVLVYSLIAFSVAAVFFKTDISNSEMVLLALFSAVTALSFQPVKSFFDKFTNRYFYRDAYDPQEMLNELNSSLVSNSKVENLLGDAAVIIASRLRPDFCVFILNDIESGKSFAYGTKTVHTSAPESETIADFMKKSEQKTTVTSEIEGHADAKKVLDKHKVEATTKLIVGNQTIGYLMLGARRSGSVYGRRDIQLLETAADSVAIAAQNALRFEEIAQFNAELEKKIEDATGKLQKSNEKLKALDEAKDEFISMASHQLRTPLTSVKGYISMILEGDTGPVSDQQRMFLDQAFISSQRMVYLIADLLNVSRLKTGKFVIEPKATYLPDVIESEISQLHETAKSRELTLTFNKPKTFPTLNLDEVKTRQVIMNFTDNAIYYTPKGGKITLDLKESKGMVEFTVHDTGIGVPKSEQHHLFTKFYRAGNAKKARPDGTGLGLFMAKKVIVAQGGAILFHTEEGKGSTFGFTFPLAKLEATANPTPLVTAVRE